MTTKYTLYTGRRSGAACVEVLLAALGLEVELREAAPWTDPVGPFYDELKNVNPLAQLPTLVTPGGEVLTESVAILWTLLERHPGDWVPAPSSRDRAACLRWMQFAASTIYTAVGIADYPERWTTATDAAAREAVKDGALARMRLGWDIVAGAHGGGRFFLGDRPAVCDVYFSNLSQWWKMREYLRARHPAFCDAMERVDGLPEVAPVWQRHWS
jgi:GST-like protein